MKIALFIIGLLSLATLTNAGTFLEAKHRASMSTNTQSAEALVNNLKQTDFGKSVLNLLSLQFKTSGKLADVNALINNLQASIAAQQADDDQKYSQTSANNQQIIADQSNIIETSSQNIQNYQQQLNDAQSSLSQLRITQQQLIEDREAINALIAAKTQQRAVEAAAFEKRVADTKVLINGIQKTIVLFQQAVSGGQFNANEVGKLVGLLNNLEAAFAAAIAEDEQQEAQAIQDFNEFLAEKNAKLQEIAANLTSIALEISRLEALVSQLQDAIAAQIVVRSNAVTLRDRTVEAQKALDERYASNKAVRADQLKLLSSALVTLNKNSSDVQNYLNQA